MFLILGRMSEFQVQAPARVNIIGEHTDYNGGFVLPTTTALFTRVSATTRPDRNVEVRSTNLDDTQTFTLDNLRPVDDVTWVEYVRGVAAELQADGIPLPGLNIEIDSDIPLGGGLSSSASLELAVATAMLRAAGATVAVDRLARLCQRAEHNYAGVQCGIMDQYTIACAQKGNAILLDCRSLDVVQVSIPDNARLIVTDSGVRHRLPDGNYNDRADECAAAVRLLARVVPGLTTLRDLYVDALEEHKELLGDALYRRCRHIVTENSRVHRAVDALDNANLPVLGTLLNACHKSLKNDFEISCAEVDALVEVANACDGVLGSRMIGGGFGGCVLSLTTVDAVDEAAAQIATNYGHVLGNEPWLHVVQAADPVREVVAQ
jgi:galactokinase